MSLAYQSADLLQRLCFRFSLLPLELAFALECLRALGLREHCCLFFLFAPPLRQRRLIRCGQFAGGLSGHLAQVLRDHFMRAIDRLLGAFDDLRLRLRGNTAPAFFQLLQMRGEQRIEGSVTVFLDRSRDRGNFGLQLLGFALTSELRIALACKDFVYVLVVAAAREFDQPPNLLGIVDGLSGCLTNFGRAALDHECRQHLRVLCFARCVQSLLLHGRRSALPLLRSLRLRHRLRLRRDRWRGLALGGRRTGSGGGRKRLAKAREQRHRINLEATQGGHSIGSARTFVCQWVQPPDDTPTAFGRNGSSAVQPAGTFAGRMNVRPPVVACARTA